MWFPLIWSILTFWVSKYYEMNCPVFIANKTSPLFLKPIALGMLSPWLSKVKTLVHEDTTAYSFITHKLRLWIECSSWINARQFLYTKIDRRAEFSPTRGLSQSFGIAISLKTLSPKSNTKTKLIDSFLVFFLATQCTAPLTKASGSDSYQNHIK